MTEEIEEIAGDGKGDGRTKTFKEREVERLLNDLATVGGKLTAEEDIVFRGTKIVLPETMTLPEAIETLKAKRKEDEQTVSFSRMFNYRPWDGARATMNALKKAFGFITQVSTHSFFGEQPPHLITISVGHNQNEQVPWGRMLVPHLPGVQLDLEGEMTQEYGLIFGISAQGPKKYRHHVEGLFNLVQRELETNSLYRGKAFDGQRMPQFLDLGGVDPKKVVYAQETRTQLEANIWSLLRYSRQMEDLGVPLKRAVLLEGPFGTGKTLAAYLTARTAVENGWTFLLCRPGRDDLREVMGTARLYQPAVVFFEDVDTVASAESNNVQQLLDIFDGIQAKGTRIIAVLTTNHVERIHKGMVRPGRLDAVIHIGTLDPAGVRKLVEATVPEDLLAPNMDWPTVTSAMDGFLPAFVREAIDRTVRYNVARNKGTVSKLEAADFAAAAEGLRPQLALMEGAKDVPSRELLAHTFSEVVKDALHDAELKDVDDDAMYWLKTR